MKVIDTLFASEVEPVLEIIARVVFESPGTMLRALLLLAVCLGICVFVDGAIDRASDDRAR